MFGYNCAPLPSVLRGLAHAALSSNLSSQKAGQIFSQVFQSQCTASMTHPGCAGLLSACSDTVCTPGLCDISVQRLGGIRVRTLGCMSTDPPAGEWKKHILKYSQKWQVSDRRRGSVQLRSRNVVQGTRLVLLVLKQVICNVQPAALGAWFAVCVCSVSRASQMFSIS